MDNRRFRTLNRELRKIFGEKIVKLSVNGDFTCPNRDGTLGNQGCLFCSEEGNGAFAGNPDESITDQIQKQIQNLSNKWKARRYIVYFGSFTNTYDSVANLRAKYEEALAYPGVVGLAIATRGDCLSDEVIQLLDEMNERCFLWVEIGLQTIHEHTISLIRRGYDMTLFFERYHQLKRSRIRVVLHLIFGLPGETDQDMMETVDTVSHLQPWGVKFHLLHVLKNTELATLYDKGRVAMMDFECYVNLVCNALERLAPQIVVHRVTGDGKKEDLIAPLWSLNKMKVLSRINQVLDERDTVQGRNFQIN